MCACLDHLLGWDGKLKLSQKPAVSKLMKHCQTEALRAQSWEGIDWDEYAGIHDIRYCILPSSLHAN